MKTRFFSIRCPNYRGTVRIRAEVRSRWRQQEVPRLQRGNASQR